MAHADRIAQHIHAAYSAAVLGRGSVGGVEHTLAQEMKSNADLRQAVEAEANRLERVRKRCFVSGKSADTLKRALAIKPEDLQNKDDPDMPSKLKALAAQAKDKVKNVENEAEDALNTLHKAEQNALAGVGKIRNVAADMNHSADELNDFANQTSNFPPTDEK